MINCQLLSWFTKNKYYTKKSYDGVVCRKTMFGSISMCICRKKHVLCHWGLEDEAQIMKVVNKYNGDNLQSRISSIQQHYSMYTRN